MSKPPQRSMTLSQHEWSAIFSAIHYADRELHAKRVRDYHKIFDWEELYPALLEKLNKVRLP